MLVCCLVFLALICFFPFVAALFGRYPLNLTSNIAWVLLGLILLVQTLFYMLALKRGKISQTFSPQQALTTHSVNVMVSLFTAFLYHRRVCALEFSQPSFCLILGSFDLAFCAHTETLESTSNGRLNDRQNQNYTCKIAAPIQLLWRKRMEARHAFAAAISRSSDKSRCQLATTIPA